LEQVDVVAVAVKRTADPTVAPLLGLLTVTPANAEVASAAMKPTHKKVLLMLPGSPKFCLICFCNGRDGTD
jgi:hypothetical protein